MGAIDVKRYIASKGSLFSKKVSDYCIILDHKINASILGNEVVDWIRIDDLKNDPTGIDSMRTLAANEMNGMFFEIQSGDVLVARLGPTILNQKIVKVASTERRTLASAEFLVLRCINKCHVDEVMCVVRTDYYKNLMYSHSRGSTQSRYRLNRADMLELPFPKLTENLRITSAVMLKALKVKAGKLREAEDLINSIDGYVRKTIGIPTENRIRPLFFGAKISTANVGRFDPEFHSPFYQNGVNRIKAMNHDTLGNIAEFSNETWNQKSDFLDMFPYIEISSVGIKTNEYEITQVPLAEAPSRAKMIVRNNDILISTTRPHRGAIATIDCADNNYFVASTGFSVLRQIKRSDISREYLQWILLNDCILQQFLQRSSGGNYPAIIQSELKKVVIPIPDEDIQLKIVKEASHRQQTAKNLKHEAEAEWLAAKACFEREILSQ